MASTASTTRSSPLLVTVADAQTTRGCRLEETTGGAMLNAVTKQPFTLADACVARGAHVGYDPVGASAVRAAVRAFAEERLLQSRGTGSPASRRRAG